MTNLPESSEWAASRLPSASEVDVFRGLTKQQAVIMHRLACGLSNKEIAQQLRLSPSTVKTHVLMIYQKTKLRNRIALALHWLLFTGALVRASRDRMN